MSENIEIEKDNANYSYDVSLRRKIIIGIVALIGFITTIKLAVIYYNANFLVNAPASFCKINEFVDCDGVAKTLESQFWGIPLAGWGLFLYFFIGLLMSAKKLAQYRIFRFLEVFKNPYLYISALGIIAFTISMSLLFISLYKIKKVCILCLFTYVLNLIIGLIAMDYSKGGFWRVFKQSFLDFVAAIKIKKYLIAFIVVLSCAVGFLIYSSVSYKFAPQAKHVKSMQKYINLNEKRENPYMVSGNVLGTEGGTVKLITFSDFRCPICQVYNIIIHKVVSELDGVEVIHHQYPLDMNCNSHINLQVHPGACALAKYAIAAEKQGNYWGVASEIYLKQPLTDFDVWVIASQQGLSVDKLKQDVQSPEVDNQLKNDIEYSASFNLHGTPAIKINDGPLIMGAITDYELKQKLIDAGAKEKVNAK